MVNTDYKLKDTVEIEGYQYSISVKEQQRRHPHRMPPTPRRYIGEIEWQHTTTGKSYPSHLETKHTITVPLEEDVGWIREKWKPIESHLSVKEIADRLINHMENEWRNEDIPTLEEI